jgi:hypothetical protein
MAKLNNYWGYNPRFDELVSWLSESEADYWFDLDTEQMMVGERVADRYHALVLLEKLTAEVKRDVSLTRLLLAMQRVCGRNRRRSALFTDWLRACCRAEGFAPSSALMESWLSFSGIPIDTRVFSRKLRACGFTKRHTRMGEFYFGISLAEHKTFIQENLI